jgi:hypothetical protein
VRVTDFYKPFNRYEIIIIHALKNSVQKTKYKYCREISTLPNNLLSHYIDPNNLLSVYEEDLEAQH